MQPHVMIPAGGLLPFGVIFVEFFFILNSLYADQYYYLFGFLLFIFCMFVVICAEISIVLTYFQVSMTQSAPLMS